MWEHQLPSKQPQQPTSCCESLPVCAEVASSPPLFSPSSYPLPNTLQQGSEQDAVPRRTLGPHQAEDIEWDKIDGLANPRLIYLFFFYLTMDNGFMATHAFWEYCSATQRGSG